MRTAPSLLLATMLCASTASATPPGPSHEQQAQVLRARGDRAGAARHYAASATGYLQRAQSRSVHPAERFESAHAASVSFGHAAEATASLAAEHHAAGRTGPARAARAQAATLHDAQADSLHLAAAQHSAWHAGTDAHDPIAARAHERVRVGLRANATTARAAATALRTPPAQRAAAPATAGTRAPAGLPGTQRGLRGPLAETRGPLPFSAPPPLQVTPGGVFARP